MKNKLRMLSVFLAFAIAASSNAPAVVQVVKAAEEQSASSDATTPETTPAPSEAPEATATPAPSEAPEATATPAPSEAPEATATPAPSQAPEVPLDDKAGADGIFDKWTEENKVDGNTTVCAVENGWLHIKSGDKNGNNPGTSPAMFVNPNTFDFTKEGYFEFTMKSNNANSGQNDSDRFGIYLGYNGDKNGMFVGYDNGGWFWQKYTNGGGDWYQGTRKPAPKKGEEVKVRIEWTADKKMTFKLNGETVFSGEDFSGISSTLGSKIAIKGGSWGNTTTDIFLKDIHYTGQKEETQTEWTPDNVIEGNNAVCEEKDGWLIVKSGSKNGNNPGTKPAIFVNENTFDFSKNGYFEFTMKSNNENKGIDNCDRFGIYLGYNGDKNGMFVGYDNVGWFWQKYTNGGGDWYQGTRKPAPKKGEEVKVRIEWTADKKMTFKLNGETVFSGEDFSKIASTLGNKIAIKGGSYGSTVTDVMLKDISYTGKDGIVEYEVSGKVTDTEGKPLSGVTVTIGEEKLTTDEKGVYSVQLPNGEYELKAEKFGYGSVSQKITVKDGALNVADIKMEKGAAVETEKLSTESMDVFVSKTFPQVVRYEMKGDLQGKTFAGQSQIALDTIRINGVDVKVDAESVKATFEGNKATYVMTVKDEANHIDAEITAELVANGNELAFNITKIDNKLQSQTEKNKYGMDVEKYPVQTVSIPNHSLISVSSKQQGANFKGATMSSNTHISGDEYMEVNDKAELWNNRDFMYAFVSNSEMSAGMWSNSEHEGRAAAAGVRGGSHNTRIYATVNELDGEKSLGLASAEWYYHRNVTDSKGVRYTVTETEMPQSKIIITGDCNEDKTVDWQDGAIAFRSIMNNPYKSEEVPELVAWRIAMNFGSQAQNPFLTTLDNVKRVAMHTDGLGQSVLLKGYGSEGHDSGHPDYADIGKRIGGAKDMNTLMEKGAAYGARFGIHVNASEMYPEAKAFSEEMVRRKNGNLSYGWNWIDQGIGIDGIYDLATNAKATRFNELKKLVGDNMDFVYVDVWGNLTSGNAEDSWETRKMSKMITDNGWRMTTEWGSGNEYDSTFQHWATDLTYGGYELKGENSEVMRFLRNHQKDSWVGDYPSYGGVANSPLLGGYNMKDFEGWQGRNDYDAYIKNLYTHDLMTKFLQHYQVTDWENGEPVQMSDNSETYTWTPEKKITLKADPTKPASETDVVVAERKSTDPNSEDYRNRTVTLNGKVISKGAVARGDNGEGGTETYLIPWLWDSATGERVSADKEKLYHWNTLGGTTEWELPNGWEGLSEVVVYKLTDLGKTEMQKVPVVDGKVTLTAEKETPYIVLKSEQGNLDITWSEGMHIVDAGFNAGEKALAENWKHEGDGSAAIAKSQFSNPMLKMEGEIEMTQEITGLTPGETYAVYVGVDNRSDSKAAITVEENGEVLDTNYTERSIAKNYVKAYTHSNSSATVDKSSYFQNMYVTFTAPEDGTATLSLSKEAGEGSVYFDDIRVVESDMHAVQKDENGNVVGLVQDFENSVQGLYPFVVGGIEGVEDNRTHLSEKHAPYTQAGWDVKKMDDVLTKNDPDSNWSIKVNGLCQRGNLVMQTIPQNFRFEPGRKYKVSFDYQAGSNGIYGVVVGDGEVNGGEPLTELPMAMGKEAENTYSFEITGAASGQTWFGIYSTTKAPDLQGTSGAAANFGGYKDFVLDNLKIELVEEEVNTDILKDLIEEAKATYSAGDYLDEDWARFEKAMIDAQVALDKDNVTQEDIEHAFYMLRAQMSALDSAPGTEATDKYDVAVDSYTVKAGSEYPNKDEGPATLAQDGDASTIWHTSYAEDAGNPVQDGNAWYQFDLKEPQNINGLRYLPRSGSNNGKLKTVKIEYSTDGGNTWNPAPAKQKEADGTFSFESAGKWQKASFAEELKGVTNLKMTAVETLGDTPNKHASAAELRVTQYVEPEAPVVDKTELKAAVDGAKALKQEDYTTASWQNLPKYITAAEAVLNKTDATAYDVALALANLNDAVDALVKKGDKAPLKDAMDKANALNKDSYTAESWSVLETALAAAQAVMDNAEATQADVDKAIADIQAAIAGLETKPSPEKPDTSKLEAAVKQAETLKAEDYRQSSWDKFSQALANAKAVLANANATQGEVDAALAALQIAQNALEKAPDKSGLQNAVNEGGKLNGSNYVYATWQNFEKAYKHAVNVLNDRNATQADVDAALKALNDAKAALAPVNNGGGSNNGGNNGGNGTQTPPSVQTGDTTPLAALFATLTAAAVGAVTFWKKKKEQ